MTSTPNRKLTSNGQTTAPIELDLKSQISKQSFPPNHDMIQLGESASATSVGSTNAVPDRPFAPSECSDAGFSGPYNKDANQVSVAMAELGKQSSQQGATDESDKIEDLTNEHLQFESENGMETGGPNPRERIESAQGPGQLKVDEHREELSAREGAEGIRCVRDKRN